MCGIIIGKIWDRLVEEFHGKDGGMLEGCWRDVGDIPEGEKPHRIRMQLNCLTR